jgi:XTP/dITP diphosphohydrolase
MGLELLYATNNSGKVTEIKKLLQHHGIDVVSPADLEIDLDVPETGNSLEENAILKVRGFRALTKKVGDRLILSDDTGLEIDELNKEPGIHVRRWKDGTARMTDEEIIRYCIQRMKGIPQDKRTAQFRTVLALGLPSGEIEIFDGTLKGRILEKPDPLRVKDFPFASLLYVDEWKMLMGKSHQLAAAEKNGRLNHREKALEKAIPRIRELIEEIAAS